MTLRSLHLGPVNLSKGRPVLPSPFFFFSPSSPLALFLQRKDAMLANREKIQFWSFYLFFFMLLLFIVLFLLFQQISVIFSLEKMFEGILLKVLEVEK